MCQRSTPLFPFRPKSSLESQPRASLHSQNVIDVKIGWRWLRQNMDGGSRPEIVRKHSLCPQPQEPQEMQEFRNSPHQSTKAPMWANFQGSSTVPPTSLLLCFCMYFSSSSKLQSPMGARILFIPTMVSFSYNSKICTNILHVCKAHCSLLLLLNDIGKPHFLPFSMTLFHCKWIHHHCQKCYWTHYSNFSIGSQGWVLFFLRFLSFSLFLLVNTGRNWIYLMKIILFINYRYCFGVI